MSLQQSLKEPFSSLGFFIANETISLYDSKKILEYTLPSTNPTTKEKIIEDYKFENIRSVKDPPKSFKIHLVKSPKILIVRRLAFDAHLEVIYQSIIEFLLTRSCSVFVESNTTENKAALIFSQDLASQINLIISLGGDGTVIWAIKLFNNLPIPPIIAFNFGSLGFMATFSLSNGIETLKKILDSSEVNLELFSRLQYTIIDGDNLLQGQASNEICIDRGAYGNVMEVEVYLNGEYCTTSVGDGLLIATPCGSTAYSLSAGGSIVHNTIAGILITPICPHSLSFRPLIIPDSVVITLKVPVDGRVSGWVKIDGATKYKLGFGAIIEIKVSEFSIPCKGYLDVILDNGYTN